MRGHLAGGGGMRLKLSSADRPRRVAYISPYMHRSDAAPQSLCATRAQGITDKIGPPCIRKYRDAVDWNALVFSGTHFDRRVESTYERESFPI